MGHLYRQMLQLILYHVHQLHHPLQLLLRVDLLSREQRAITRSPVSIHILDLRVNLVHQRHPLPPSQIQRHLVIRLIHLQAVLIESSVSMVLLHLTTLGHMHLVLVFHLDLMALRPVILAMIRNA